MKKIVSNKYMLLVLMLFIITIVVVFLFLSINNNSRDNLTNTEPINDYKYEVNDILLNGFDLQKEHCLDNICIKDLILYYSVDSVSFVRGLVYNKDLKSKDKCLKFTFNNVGEVPFELKTCFYDITPNEEFELELQFNSEGINVIGIDNYILSEYNN